LPAIAVPARWRFQPIDAREVADRIVELALDTPSGPVPDIAGPGVYEMAELVRTYLHARGKHRLILPVWTPGKAARVFRSGANLAPDRAVGGLIWEDFLAAAMTSPMASALPGT
ncbi:MAG TPA: nucleoside-diphosphate sugar epimerase, partial [Propionibacteriaceae bacterium]|nr:nucleoside-diphosphate sugar epimerase [Propionibacteriaceae bacterium]